MFQVDDSEDDEGEEVSEIDLLQVKFVKNLLSRHKFQKRI